MTKKKNFTLMELLIVIGIIAILASMLLPALKTAMDSAKSIQCLGNVKQLFMPFQSYCSDNNNFFMPYAKPKSYHASNMNTLWSLSIERDAFNIPGAGKYSIPKLKILICPSEKDKPQAHSGVSSHYGYTKETDKTIGYDLEGAPNGDFSKHRDLNLKEPSKAFVVGDTQWYVRNSHGDLSPGLWSSVLRIDSILSNQGIRHREGSNNLFSDGHAEWKRYPFFELNPNYINSLK